MSVAKRKTKPSTAVAVRKPQPPSAVADSKSIMAMIGAASKDKTVDVAKMERLVELYERITKNEQKAAYASSLVAMKPRLPVIDRRGRITVRAKDSSGNRTGAITQDTPFARWEDIDEAITPVLSEHGFALTHKTSDMPDGRLRVTAILTHTLGHIEEGASMVLPFDTTGSKNNVQAIGSSLSYGKRYTAIATLNIRTKGEDDDGNKGGDEADSLKFITPAQVDQLLSACADAKIDKTKFCTAFMISEVEELPAMRLQEALDRVAEFKRKGFQKQPASATV